MKTINMLAALALVLGCTGLSAAVVKPQDDGRALINPDMGWTMHYYSNVPANYGSTIEPGDSMKWFPGCSVCYLRIPWAYLEPEEGVYNWAALDTPAQRWIERGGQIAFRISCSESWLRFATPEWVKKAGAKGVFWDFPKGPNPNGALWDPDFADPIFLAKLENFLRAFAKRYDGRPEVAFMDIGTYGLWGEGHTFISTRVPQAQMNIDVKKHIDLHVKCFPKTQLVISDDVAGPFECPAYPLLDYARSKGVGWRDDSIMVQPPPRSWFHVDQTEHYWRTLPVVLEHEHYLPAKDKKAWSAELLEKSVEDMHASYMSIHGPARQLLDENRDAIDRINRRLGYRFQLREASWPDAIQVGTSPAPFSVRWSWANAGVAPCLRDAYPCLTVKDEKGGIVAVFADDGLNLRTLEVGKPGAAPVKTHEMRQLFGRWKAPTVKAGEFDVFVSVGKVDGTPVYELPLLHDDGHRRYRLGRIRFADAPAADVALDARNNPAQPQVRRSMTDAKPMAAEPVWPAGRETERNLFVGFRTRFDGAKAKTLRYSASSIARIWLNGKFLAYGPARGPHGLDRVDEIPLSGCVTNGPNTLAFEVAGYNIESFYLLNEPAYLRAEVLDGEGHVLAKTSATNSDFEAFILSERVQKVPRFSYQRPFCEIYALAPTSTAWRVGAPRGPRAQLARATGSSTIDRVFPYPDYAVSSVFHPICGGRLERRAPARLHRGRSVMGERQPQRGYAASEIAIQPVREIQSLPTVDRHAVAETNVYAFTEKSYVLFDHALNDTGFLGARVVCRKPGRVYFYFDEVLVKGDINVARMGWQCVNAVTYDFTQPGVYDIEAFEPNTFRYLKVMSDTFEGDVSGLFVRAYKNAGVKGATFQSTDPALDKIFAAAKETFAQNAVDAFTDCPSRERAGWLCDSFFTARVAALLTGDTSVERGFLQNYVKCPKSIEGGFLPMCYPADAGLLPNWNFWLILELNEYLARSGDRALVDAFKPKVLDIVEAFRRYRNSDGLLEKLPGWVFIEWSRANALVQDVNYPSNMTWAEVLEVVARLYDRPDCAEEARKVRETVLRQSWTGEWFCDNAVRQKDGSLKLSGECTETCQYYAFYFHLVSPETRPQLWARLLKDFGPQRKQTRKYPQIAFANALVGNYLRLELLARTGHAQQILDETKGYFLGMAEKTGTLWEHDNTSNSCDHGFASHVAVTLVRDLLGVDIDRRTGKVTIRPTDATLQGAKLTLPTPTKTIEIDWKPNGKAAVTNR